MNFGNDNGQGSAKTADTCDGAPAAAPRLKLTRQRVASLCLKTGIRTGDAGGSGGGGGGGPPPTVYCGDAN